MANQIPFLTSQALAHGRTAYYWRPSPRLRRAGWTLLTLGEDRRAAILAALERNEEVAAWDRDRGGAPPAAAARAPIRPRWRDLVATYKADPAYLELKPKTRAEYDSRLRTLAAWADDGALVLADLDRPMIVDLRTALIADGRKHRTGALLRVLRLLLNYGAGRGWLPLGLAAGISIPEAPARRRILAPAEVAAMAARGRAEGTPAGARMALAITLAFWTFQREGDLLGLSRLAWREMRDMSARARAILAAGGDGRVLGFRLQQAKTGAWVDLPLPQQLRAEVEAGFAAQDAQERAGGLLLPRAGQEGRIPQWAFQRHFRALAEAEGIDDAQFRDLRRSGMILFGELGTALQFITAMSGHAVLGNKRTILDTYMPGNSRFAAEGMATAWSRWQERQREAEQEGQG